MVTPRPTYSKFRASICDFCSPPISYRQQIRRRRIATLRKELFEELCEDLEESVYAIIPAVKRVVEKTDERSPAKYEQNPSDSEHEDMDLM